MNTRFLRVLGTTDHVAHLRLFSMDFWLCTSLGRGEMRKNSQSFINHFFLDAITHIYKNSCQMVHGSVIPSFNDWCEIRGQSKKSVSWSRPYREVRFFAWCSACLKYHISSIFRCCKILTIFAVFCGKFWSEKFSFQNFPWKTAKTAKN